MAVKLNGVEFPIPEGPDRRQALRDRAVEFCAEALRPDTATFAWKSEGSSILYVTSGNQEFRLAVLRVSASTGKIVVLDSKKIDSEPGR